MRLDQIDQMSEVMRALYDREFRSIGAILAEESTLRGKLTQLDSQIAENQNVTNNSHALNAVGAQILWQSWTSRTRRQLNSELAQVMAKKLMAIDRVRIAFGRQRAVEMMMESKRLDQQKRRRQNRESNLLSLN